MDSIFNIEVLTQNIIDLCEKENVSVNRMLKECGLSKSVIGNLKKGYEPQLAKIVIIADYFGVTVDYLINNSPVGSGKEDNHVACSYPNDYFLTREEAQETLNKNGGAEK